MKKIYVSLSFCLFAFAGLLHAQNPYASLGEETTVLTLSEGKYQEHFPNENLVAIGGVKLNIVTGEVVEFIDSKKEQDAFTSTVNTRFLSVDPIGRQYPELTPYQFASNTPIESIDLDGLERLSATVDFAFTMAGKKSFMSGSISAGIATEGNSGHLNLNVEAKFANGGQGFRKGNPGKGFMADLIISPSFSLNVGKSTQEALKKINTFTGESASNVSSNFEHSVTYGQNIIFNSEGRNQRSGAIGASSGKLTFNIYNDVKWFLGDFDDRFWTGGGFVNVNLNENLNIKFGTDTYTAEPVINTNSSSDYLGGDGYRYANSFSRLNKDYNVGRTFLNLEGKTSFRGEYTGFSIGLSSIGGRQNMWSQDGIHDRLTEGGFHRFPVTLKKPNLQLRAAILGNIDNSTEEK